MSSEASGVGVKGLRLDLPTDPTGPTQVTVQGLAYVADRTAGDSSGFFGFVFAPEGLSPTVEANAWESAGR